MGVLLPLLISGRGGVLTRISADTEEEEDVNECSSVSSVSNVSLVLVFVVDLNTVLLALFSVLRVVSIYVEAAKKIGPILFRLEFPVG